MIFLRSWLIEDDAYLVEDEELTQLAAWATGVYDKDSWRSDDIPEDVWEVVNAGCVSEVTRRIKAGETWAQAMQAAMR